jgi:hypothetical protein
MRSLMAYQVTSEKCAKPFCSNEVRPRKFKQGAIPKYCVRHSKKLSSKYRYYVKKRNEK